MNWRWFGQMPRSLLRGYLPPAFASAWREIAGASSLTTCSTSRASSLPPAGQIKRISGGRGGEPVGAENRIGSEHFRIGHNADRSACIRGRGPASPKLHLIGRLIPCVTAPDNHRGKRRTRVATRPGWKIRAESPPSAPARLLGRAKILTDLIIPRSPGIALVGHGRR